MLGFEAHSGEHKTQWLSFEGEPAYKSVFLEMLREAPGGPPHVDSRPISHILRRRTRVLARLLQKTRPTPPTTKPKSPNRFEKTQRSTHASQRADIAASLQSAVEDMVCDWLSALRIQIRRRQVLCLAGGLFLNPLLVAAVETRCRLRASLRPTCRGQRRHRSGRRLACASSKCINSTRFAPHSRHLRAKIEARY